MAKVYVGTYRKYNNGSLAGGWLDLADYNDYGAFIAACKKMHEDENDPEFLIEDSEGFPDGLDCCEWIYEEEFNDVKAAMADSTGISIVDYSAKAFAVVGDTKPLRAQLVKLGGRFNKRLTCGAGWIFSNKKREDVEAFLANKGVICANTNSASAPANANNDAELFTGWLNEYGANNKYLAGAIKFHDGFILIEKPLIENKFCFHDEGADYELYCSLKADDKKMAEYFKRENLRQFDSKIERIEKGGTSRDTRIWWYVDPYRSELRYICYSTMSYENDFVLCTDEEKSLILRGLKFGRDLFEKRLDAYLKRYGVSKLHTWTYWADA